MEPSIRLLLERGKRQRKKGVGVRRMEKRAFSLPLFLSTQFRPAAVPVCAVWNNRNNIIHYVYVARTNTIVATHRPSHRRRDTCRQSWLDRVDGAERETNNNEVLDDWSLLCLQQKWLKGEWMRGGEAVQRASIISSHRTQPPSLFSSSGAGSDKSNESNQIINFNSYCRRGSKKLIMSDGTPAQNINIHEQVAFIQCVIND